jgi:hypothetical protein
MSSGQIVGALCRPITKLEALRALTNGIREPKNVGHLHMPIRVEGWSPDGNPCQFTQRRMSPLSLESPVSLEA